MIRVSRLLVSALAFGFGSLQAIFGLLHLDQFQNPMLIIAVSCFYIVILFSSLAIGARLAIPIWLAWVLMIFSVTAPIVEHTQHVGKLIGNYDTWWVTGVAILLSILAVRGYPGLAATGGVILGLEVVYFGGLAFVPVSGIIGAGLLILACIAISIGLQRADVEIAKYQEETLSQEAEQSALNAARELHDQQVRAVSKRALPLLQLLAQGKKLTKQQRKDVQELDAELRDEVTGGELMLPILKNAVAKARAQGVEVSVIDGGVIGRVSRQELEELIEIAVAAMAGVSTGRIKLEAPKSGNHILRLTATRPGIATPDLDLKLGERLA